MDRVAVKLPSSSPSWGTCSSNIMEWKMNSGTGEPGAHEAEGTDQIRNGDFSVPVSADGPLFKRRCGSGASCNQDGIGWRRAALRLDVVPSPPRSACEGLLNSMPTFFS
jgi:hypothetical protein